jgi:hypothetical protein
LERFDSYLARSLPPPWTDERCVLSGKFGIEKPLLFSALHSHCDPYGIPTDPRPPAALRDYEKKPICRFAKLRKERKRKTLYPAAHPAK